MKRLIAIWFLSIFLFNLYGYQLLIDYCQSKEDRVLAKKISNNLNAQDLVSIKIATVLPPYTVNHHHYEWVDGEITVNGAIYKYVKRRIFKDSVEFLCLANTGKTHLENARENFFRLCNDLQNSSETDNKAGNQLKPVFFDYFNEASVYNTLALKQITPALPGYYLNSFPSEPRCILEQPPEA